ncbi:MAG: dihydroorotate dehydrogenase-like protein [Ancalomicrobiaceae bacterium]|nr:dihydroorotate dehydrogenase-like protein [Ancalomicrobiaceae bacterium]
MAIDLQTRYLGLDLKNPLVVSASPLSSDISRLRNLAEAGAAAIVLPSLFEEQIRHEAATVERLAAAGSDSFAESLSYFPSSAEAVTGPRRYLDFVAEAHAKIDVPIIASLNGSSVAGWVDYAGLMEAAGASAIELNIYRIASGPNSTGSQVEVDTVALAKAVKAQVKVPVAVKLHPHFSAFGALARELDAVGVDGLILFNRLFQPDIDLAKLKWVNEVDLSSPADIRLGLLWLSQLSGKLKKASLAANTGVETVDEVLKYLMAGADVVMLASALLRHGPGYLQTLLLGLEDWLAARGFKSVAEVRGLLKSKHPDSERHEREDYIESLTQYRGPYARGA